MADKLQIDGDTIFTTALNHILVDPSYRRASPSGMDDAHINPDPLL